MTTDRFSEETATFTVQGKDAPDLDRGVAAIRNVLRTLPARPGVYRMTDAGGDVLYIGKARSLRSRVTNYTQVNRLSRRLQRMVSQTRDMTIVTTNSESEALLLEAQLIKRYRPPYNVLLRDDKSFPFIFLREDHDFPRISKHRGARIGKGSYYGPFASAGAVNTTLNALQKVFLLRSCTDSFFANRTRPCLLHQIKRCSAPCVGRITDAAYGELVADAKSFLSGRTQEAQKKLGTAMQAAAEARDFELAAVLRDRLRALTFIQGSQAINAEGSASDADIIAMACQAGVMCIQIFFIRGGQNWGHRAFFPGHTDGVSEDEVLTSFLAQLYEELPPPREILLDRTLDEATLLAEALSDKAGHRVGVKAPQRGPNRKLVDQAARNAVEALDRRQAESTTQGRLLTALADLFDLAEPPRRIEVYDNSHIMGSNALGAMIVAGPEGFIKNQYRKFNMNDARITPGDDLAMMKAMLSRRFARLEKEDPDRSAGDWPDLVLIDGGRGQLAAVNAALAELGVADVVIIGVSKGFDRDAGRETFHMPDGRELHLAPNDPVLFFLQRLRDEAHRFAIGAHRAKRSRAIAANPLDDVPGIGPARKKALLMHFGTSRAVRGATLADLENAPGISKAMARAIHGHFQSGG
ncbi:excinuclease ABC subunit UvrC [Polymorphobacter fuscus]|uniref:UvrABC system protein C n=1 Tax=Sandarakinorhabdus fusca TaxID=1439888 RepID=A0A7C9KK20_9SPHN|nr:excinuclease ABC subunit UvrC [Polymorphobacter fuscus]KAB7648647.1 excinuclease ABC subunit UvrC [Polymorphobacter fuscus]MQT16203.1 excinuclease ABC subunit UvrC [Polymorphobacter fuscus]NJC07512.1 excinuclease ABC subunit C [Polymorphobacter fuscus]